MAGCEGARRARGTGPVPAQAGSARSARGVAAAMIHEDDERPGGSEGSPPPQGVPGPVTPAQAADLPARSRGGIALLEEDCTARMLCARECPDWCVFIESHKETLPAPESGRPRVRNVLDRFAIDFSLCMYWGICVEVCPYDALFWSAEFAYPETGITA